MPRIIILPYKMGSESATNLKNTLSGLRSKKVYPNRTYRPYRNHFIINWGYSELPNWYGWFSRLGLDANKHFLNHPANVKTASNKTLAFQKMKEGGVSVPNFTTNKGEAETWWRDGKHIMVRHLTRANSGRGAEYIPAYGSDGCTLESLPNAPLYVEYIKKQDEYRVHVFNGEVIDVQQKKKRREVDNETVNYQIRNACNGWVFCREGINPNEKVLEEAKKAVASLGLDFGGVDIIFNTNRQEAYVIEVNTAVGLEGTTLENYKNAIVKWACT